MNINHILFADIFVINHFTLFSEINKGNLIFFEISSA